MSRSLPGDRRPARNHNSGSGWQNGPSPGYHWGTMALEDNSSHYVLIIYVLSQHWIKQTSRAVSEGDIQC